TVTFDGPAGWEKNLKAYADYPFQVVGSPTDFPSAPVVLEQNGAALDTTTYTLPKAGLDISTVSIHIEAKSGTTSRQVTLIDASPVNPPPTCYRVTGITVDPVSVTVTGPADILANVTTITLPAVDLGPHNANFTFRVAIPFPTGITGNATTARVAYSISQNPNCTAPTPT
ncbi:MAG TPA: YbbR-like domain-containing protein, partial [Candidatus Dormibacteraeota bacterium]|nr:YbbR-like domain-containing protein [Candidatus Dormibacteraeota bacterium]